MSRRVSKPLRTLYHEPIQAEACLRGNRPQDGTSPWWRYVINFIRSLVGLGFMKAQVFMKKTLLFLSLIPRSIHLTKQPKSRLYRFGWWNVASLRVSCCSPPQILAFQEIWVSFALTCNYKLCCLLMASYCPWIWIQPQSKYMFEKETLEGNPGSLKNILCPS